MKLARIIDLEFQKALKKLNASTLPLKTAFKLKSISKTVQEQLDNYDEVRMTALNRHGQKDAEGKLVTKDDGNVSLTQEGAQAFLLEMQELVNLEVDIPTVSVSELGDNVSLSADDLFQLDGLITD